MKGKKFEQDGQIDEAIKCYERSVKDRFDGNFPYDRLAIIYRRLKRFSDEIRVLERAIEIFEADVSASRVDREPKLAKFRARLSKANALVEKALPGGHGPKPARRKPGTSKSRQVVDTLVAFDLETTGLDSTSETIIEIAGVRFDLNGDRSGEFQELVNPERAISKETTRLTGITSADVESAPSAQEVLAGFVHWVGENGVLVAHNAPFDARFLLAVSRKHDVELPSEWQIVDTLRWARSSKIDSEDNRLETLLRAIGKPGGTTHRALGDARGVVDLALHLASQLKNPQAAIRRRLTSLPEMSVEPATGRQLGYLRDLGARPEELDGLDKFAASQLIDRYKRESPKTDRYTTDEEVHGKGCLAAIALVVAIAVLVTLF